MKQNQAIQIIQSLLGEAKTAVLATTDGKGVPRLRWMTPMLFPTRPGAIYAITSPHFAKAEQIEKRPHVEWIFQTVTLNEIMNVRGKVNLIRNPSLQAEILEGITKWLRVFWNLSSTRTDLVVLETVIEECRHFLPMEGKKEIVKFSQRPSHARKKVNSKT